MQRFLRPPTQSYSLLVPLKSKVSTSAVSEVTNGRGGERDSMLTQHLSDEGPAVAAATPLLLLAAVVSIVSILTRTV